MGSSLSILLDFQIRFFYALQSKSTFIIKKECSLPIRADRGGSVDHSSQLNNCNPTVKEFLPLNVKNLTFGCIKFWWFCPLENYLFPLLYFLLLAGLFYFCIYIQQAITQKLRACDNAQLTFTNFIHHVVARLAETLITTE